MIFDEQIARKPNLYPWTDKFIESMHNGFWTHREFNFQSDVHDFRTKLNENEKEIVIRALSAIGQIEIQVKTWWAKIGENLPHPSIIDLGFVMANTEVIHGDAYERLLEVLGIEDVFEKNLQLDIIKGRVNYLKKHTHKFHSNNKKQFVYSLILFTLFVENVSLFSQFYVINWFGRFKNYLKDTNKQTEYSAREEQIHALVGVQMINTIRKEYPELFDSELQEKVEYEVKQALKYESEIVDWMINGLTEDGLNAELLKTFIMNRMNNSLEMIGFSRQFDVDLILLKKTRWFDEQILGNNSTDFFNSKPVEYSKSSQSFDENDLF